MHYLPLLLGLVSSAIHAEPIPLCFDHGCRTQMSFQPTAAEWSELTRLFAPSPAEAGEERARIAAAIALFERIAARHSGKTHLDRGGNAAGSGEPGQMDCIDESTNTHNYLNRLERAGLLRHHRVVERHKRTRWLITAHWSAVVEERATGARYVVDSWFRDNGEEPVIYPLEQWMRGDDPVSPPPLR